MQVTTEKYQFPILQSLPYQLQLSAVTFSVITAQVINFDVFISITVVKMSNKLIVNFWETDQYGCVCF